MPAIYPKGILLTLHCQIDTLTEGILYLIFVRCLESCESLQQANLLLNEEAVH